MKIIDRLGEYCYPVSILLDIELLNKSIEQLFLDLGVNLPWFLDKLNYGPATTINLTHLPILTGKDRWLKYNGNHDRTLAEGANEKEFTEILEEIKGTYIEYALKTIFSNHKQIYGTEFSGRCQIIASRPTFGYRIHRDLHTEHRYHVPLITDRNFYFLFKDNQEDYSLLHMPADGRAWYLNPRDIYHTVMHVGSQNRIHLLLTS